MMTSRKLSQVLLAPYNINPHIENEWQPISTRLENQNQKTLFDIKRYYISKTQYITKKEQECLQLYAMGKSTHEISILLNCSSHTIEKHFENIKRKFERDKLASVVYWAIKLGIIT